MPYAVRSKATTERYENIENVNNNPRWCLLMNVNFSREREEPASLLVKNYSCSVWHVFYWMMTSSLRSCIQKGWSGKAEFRLIRLTRSQRDKLSWNESGTVSGRMRQPVCAESQNHSNSHPDVFYILKWKVGRSRKNLSRVWWKIIFNSIVSGPQYGEASSGTSVNWYDCLNLKCLAM